MQFWSFKFFLIFRIWGKNQKQPFILLRNLAAIKTGRWKKDELLCRSWLDIFIKFKTYSEFLFRDSKNILIKCRTNICYLCRTVFFLECTILSSGVQDLSSGVRMNSKILSLRHRSSLLRHRSNFGARIWSARSITRTCPKEVYVIFFIF